MKHYSEQSPYKVHSIPMHLPMLKASLLMLTAITRSMRLNSITDSHGCGPKVSFSSASPQHSHSVDFG